MMKLEFITILLLLSTSAMAEDQKCLSQSEYEYILDSIQQYAEIIATSRKFVEKLETLSAVRQSLTSGKDVAKILDTLDSLTNTVITMTNSSLKMIDDSQLRSRIIERLQIIEENRKTYPTDSSEMFQSRLSEILNRAK